MGQSPPEGKLHHMIFDCRDYHPDGGLPTLGGLQAVRDIARLQMKALQQVKGMPPFAKTAKSGAPVKSETRLRSGLLERNHP
jgi:hypothetical protein